MYQFQVNERILNNNKVKMHKNTDFKTYGNIKTHAFMKILCNYLPSNTNVT